MVLNAEAVNMQFNVNGQNIVWNQPLRAVCVAGEQDGKLSLEEIRLQSDFLTLDGSASLDRGEFQIEGDLEKVMSQVGQVIDTGGIKLGGKITGELDWKLTQANTPNAMDAAPIRIDGDFKINEPLFQFPGMNAWNEKELDFSIGADGLAKAGIVSVEKGNFDIQIGNEHAQGDLAKPIENAMAASNVQFTCQADGSIAKWIAQSRNFAEFPEFFIDGNLDSQFLMTLNSDAVRLNQVQFEANDFDFDGFALRIREPKVSGSVNLNTT